MMQPSVSLSSDDHRWLAVLEALGGGPLQDRSAMRAAMSQAIARASSEALAWTTEAAFARHIALCIADDDDPLAQLHKLHVDDLALAFGCAHGKSDAVAVFRSRFSRDVERVVGKYAQLANDRADALQILLERLLVARPDAPARIADYRGRGPLQGWVRVAALRIAVDLVRAREAKREVLGAEPATAEGSIRTVEDRYVQRVFGHAVRESVESAFATLTTRDRNLLRHNVVQGLTIDQIAPIYGVHRATVARWLERARKSLATAARDVLIERHGVAASDVHSVMRCVDSQVELSIGRLLG